jgi:hypothetical protein
VLLCAGQLTAYAVYLLAGALFLLFNSWITWSWLMWPTIDRSRSALTALFRLLNTLRIVNCYGVFPPNSLAPIRSDADSAAVLSHALSLRCAG